jgi:NADPH-dependent 2,4-dienoyl-CoA reductase/sulfur reductase-like enzyme/rhodanese-related sulfurtransferase
MSQTVVVIGAMALGPKAACRFKRLSPDSRVVLVDQEEHLFYDPSGIPYFLAGDVSEPEQLQTTSFFMLRDETFFLNAKGVEVMPQTRALAIDRENKSVHLRHVRSGEERVLAYDKLVLATGTRPKTPTFHGTNLNGVFSPYRLLDAIAVKERLAKGLVERAVVIGATATGLETAEALMDVWGVDVAVVDPAAEQVLPDLVGRNMARMVQHHMEENGLRFYLSEALKGLSGEGRASEVITSRRTLEADLIILAGGLEPNARLAEEAGLELSPCGAVRVNTRMETSDPCIYAGGGCVEVKDLVTGHLTHASSVAVAQRQGRVIGTNLAGGDAEFEGVVGTFATKLFDISVAGAGLCLEQGRREGLDLVSAMVVQFDRTHYYPEKDLMVLELVVEKQSGEVVGIQGAGNKGDGMLGRVNAVAAMLKYAPTIREISNLDLPFSPPFTSALDIVNTVANVAENIIGGRNRGLALEAFQEVWASRSDADTDFIDCRGWGNAEPFVKKYPGHWKNIPQEELMSRLGEISRDRRVLLICNTGMRSYEAQLMLEQAGITDTFNLPGGIAALMKWGMAI